MVTAKCNLSLCPSGNSAQSCLDSLIPGDGALLFLVMRLLLVVSVSLALGPHFQAKQIKPDIKLTGFLGTFNNFVRVPLGNAQQNSQTKTLN
jgi:hypothetical protein